MDPEALAAWLHLTSERDRIRAERNRAEDALLSALRTLREVLDESGGITGRHKSDEVSERVRLEIASITAILFPTP
jgi:predicted RNA-binding Zn ribbon-like protein